MPIRTLTCNAECLKIYERKKLKIRKGFLRTSIYLKEFYVRQKLRNINNKYVSKLHCTYKSLRFNLNLVFYVQRLS